MSQYASAIADSASASADSPSAIDGNGVAIADACLRAVGNRGCQPAIADALSAIADALSAIAGMHGIPDRRCMCARRCTVIRDRGLASATHRCQPVIADAKAKSARGLASASGGQCIRDRRLASATQKC
jgi:hypothetical protein